MTNKVVKDGEVAVLYSPGYGAGWSTWNSDNVDMIFCPEIVQMVIDEKSDEEIEKAAKRIFGKDGYYGGVDGLCVAWVKEGTMFRINEYDGSESVETFNEDNYFVA